MENKKEDNGIHVVNLSKFTAPIITEEKARSKGKVWVNYGADNNYFQYLIDRAIHSPTNNALINGVTRAIYGEGLNSTSSTTKAGEYVRALQLLKPKDVRRFIADRKKLGMGALQVSYKNGKVAKVSHFPMNTLRSGVMNERGEVTEWFYHPNWAQRKRTELPLQIQAFGFGGNKGSKIAVLKPYSAGYDYYSPCDYQGALPYAVVEEEISDFLINDIQNSFSGRMLVNFNNGKPSDSIMESIKNDVTKKLTGATGQPLIVTFNKNKESAADIQNIPLDNAPEHYKYLAEEAKEKLIMAHSVTSPLLVGVKTGNSGLGNNADEIKNASLLFNNTVIKPMQDEILDFLQEILLEAGINISLYFETLQPLEFKDMDVLDEMSDEEAEEETGIQKDTNNIN